MTVMAYRTRDGIADYGFSIDYQPSAGWRVYIIFQSVRQDEDDSLKSPYQAIDEEKRRYVDWPKRLDNLGDAKIVAELWAEVTQGYHRDQELREMIIERCRRAQRQRRAVPTTPDISATPSPTPAGRAPDTGTPPRSSHSKGPRRSRSRILKRARKRPRTAGVS